MPSTFPRVIGDIDIALSKIFVANPADKMGHGIGHGIHMSGRSRHRLREHISILIIYSGGQIPRFSNGG